MAFHTQTLIPLMGPYPQIFKGTITRSGLPLEFSTNYTQHSSGDPVWRIGFEPVGAHSGTERDLYNQVAMSELFTRLKELGLAGYNTTLFEHFIARHTCKAMGTDFGRLFNESIEPLRDSMGDLSAFNVIDEYMEQTDGYSNFAFLSWDCVAPANSTNIVTWSKMEEIWTLGGRLSGETTMRGLGYLKRLWQLTQIRDGCRAFTGRFDNGTDSTPTPLVWNYEMRPGSPEPLSKVYFPIHGGSDLTIVRGLATFFEEIGLVEQGRSYEQNPERDLSKTACLTSWISFAYTEKTGVYLSVYYHSSSDYPWTDKEE
ncbi:aromatic prenyltransferase [Talaromyces proteolyticus]|uniref:Aromatic prenyltransferase n=1 Tax=Talaromyces proteolyticus TaxID=1131652 RepID=A0AAD4KCP7_9EURO|nr:aromatic prenyltransferase [Talaromyces proteolyticus]KAH8688639.1 aromatic prenyltransferase [Talaromyces proteolyticus]